MKLARIELVLAVSLLASSLVVSAQGDKTLLEIVTRLESEGYGPITEVSLDKGRWEVDAYKDGTPLELHIDPATGRTTSEHRDHAHPMPPAGAKKLSDIVKGLAAQGYTQIHEISFGMQTWEVEAFRDGAKRELRVDPITGKVVADRAD